MPSSVNRRPVELPLPLYAALTDLARRRRDTTARLVTHALVEWLQDKHPELVPEHPYLSKQQQQERWRAGREGPKSDGYRRF